MAVGEDEKAKWLEAMATHAASGDTLDEAGSVARASERMKRFDPTALSYWFPKLEAAGLPVPKTIFLEMPEAAQASMWKAFDGEEPSGTALADFSAQVAGACAQVGYPAFRTCRSTRRTSRFARCAL